MSDVHVNTPSDALTWDPLSNDTGVIRFLLGVQQCASPARSRFVAPRIEGQVDRVSAFHRASRIPLLAPMGKTPGFPVRHKSTERVIRALRETTDG